MGERRDGASSRFRYPIPPWLQQPTNWSDLAEYIEFTLSFLFPLSEVSVAGHSDLLVFLAAKQILKLSILTFSQLGIIVNRGILKEVQEYKVHLAGNSKV